MFGVDDAATPPCFCRWRPRCSATVVLPLDSCRRSRRHDHAATPCRPGRFEAQCSVRNARNVRVEVLAQGMMAPLPMSSQSAPDVLQFPIIPMISSSQSEWGVFCFVGESPHSVQVVIYIIGAGGSQG